MSFFIYIKMSKTLSAKYYQENKLQKKTTKKSTQKKYQNLSKEEKEKKWQYGHERYKNLSKDEKQQLVGIEKKAL